MPVSFLSIRPARKADLDAIDRIEGRSFATDRFSRPALRRLLAASTADCRVAEIDGALAGYALILFRAGTRVARLYSIAVDPAFRGHGVAQALVEAAEKASLARGSSILRLEVRASNKAGLRLYDRAGFTFLDRRSGYYSDGEEALRFEKRLS